MISKNEQLYNFPFKKKNSIKYRLIMAFLLLIIIPFLIFSSSFVYYIENTLKERVIVDHKEISKQIGQNVNMILNNMDTAATLIVANQEILHIISSDIKNDPSNYFNNAKIINNFFTDLQYSVLRYPNSFAAVRDRYGNIHTANAVSEDNVYGRIKTYMDKVEIDSLQNGSSWLGVVENTFRAQSIAPYLVTLLRNITYGSNSKSFGVIMVSIDETVFYKSIQSTMVSGTEVYILDENNKIISSTNRKMINKTFYKRHQFNYSENGTAIIDDTSNKLILTAYKLANGKWSIVQTIPYELIYSDVNRKLITFTIFGIVFLALFIIITIIILDKITSPIINLTKSMNKVKNGNLDVRVSKYRNDEVGQLSDAFNEMISQINELIKENKVKEKQKRNAELKMLRSQINPHFLFNTLLTIKWIAEINQDKLVSKLITSLSMLLKNGILNDKEYVTVQEEIENLKNYCSIQEIRYGGVFEVNYYIEEDAAQCKILNLILQPILENSIIHAFKDYMSKGEINVYAYIEQDTLVIKIQDNGIGLSDEQIEHIFVNETHEHGGIGIKNVHERLKINYGEAYGIKMLSTLGQGVTTIINIPINKETLNND